MADSVQLCFRLPKTYIPALNSTIKTSRRKRSNWLRAVLQQAYDDNCDGAGPVTKFLFYDRRKGERAKLSGPSVVIAVRVSGELGSGIRDIALRDGNTISEWCGLAILKWLPYEKG